MPIIAAYVLPHPPLAVPEVGRGQEGQIKDTLSAFSQVAREVAELAPETIVVITPHSANYSDYFHISPGESASGDFARFGAPGAKIEVLYDSSLAQEIEELAGAYGLHVGGEGERDPSLDHGVTVPLWYINREYNGYKLVRISQSGHGPDAHYKLGQAIARAADGKKVVLIASGDLSHKLAKDGPYGYAPEGPEFDRAVTAALASGDFAGLLAITGEQREKAAECGYNSFMVMAGALDGVPVEAKLLSYEGPLGVGYAVASFNLKAPKAPKAPKAEDAYQALARYSLESAVNGAKGASPDLSEEMQNRRAGVFVSLHIGGELRGCIGTIAPTTDNIAQEIMQNAVSAGLSDPRFNPVAVEELPLLNYKVDVLSEPEAVPDASYLDVKRYGVIVTYNNRRGLLLPNLDGVDTVEQQIAISCQKAGISAGSPIKLERFEVVRHG